MLPASAVVELVPYPYAFKFFGVRQFFNPRYSYLITFGRV